MTICRYWSYSAIYYLFYDILEVWINRGLPTEEKLTSKLSIIAENRESKTYHTFWQQRWGCLLSCDSFAWQFLTFKPWMSQKNQRMIFYIQSPAIVASIWYKKNLWNGTKSNRQSENQWSSAFIISSSVLWTSLGIFIGKVKMWQN